MTYSDEVWCSSIILELTLYVGSEVTPAKKTTTNKQTKNERQDLNLHFPCRTQKCREGKRDRNFAVFLSSCFKAEQLQNKI